MLFFAMVSENVAFETSEVALSNGRAGCESKFEKKVKDLAYA